MNKALDIKQLKVSCGLCTLSQLCFPHDLESDDLDELDKIIGHSITVHAGDFLYREGDTCKALYAVRSGSTKTLKQNASGES